MNPDQYITPLAQNDPRLFSNVSQAFSLVDLGKRLLDAAKNGDVEEVRSLIDGGAPFTTDWLGISPLHFSAMNGHLTTCEALLKAGISRDARTKVDRTPLHLAAQEGHADIVDLLLKSGADLEAKDMLQMTALHWAAERGHAPVVQVLMHYGANSELKNKFEMTPVEIAEFKDNSDALDAMLNTHFDHTSSVGKMAAPNDNLANADAFILTDEETLIPAAPPADEVTVTTATTPFDEPTVPSDRETSEPSTSMADVGSSSATHAPSSETSASVTECVITCEPGTGSTNGQTGPASVRHSNSICFDSKLRDAIPLPLSALESDVDLEDLNENMMVVETPDGRVLYVRQEDDFDSPKLAIFSEDGTHIHDQNLLAQVVNAIASFPAETFEREDDLDFQSSVNGFTSSKPPVECRLGDAVACHTPLLDDLDFTQEVPTILGNPGFSDVTADKDDLLAQLSQFAVDDSQIGNYISVDGICDFATRQDIFEWLSAHGLVITDYPSYSNFSVSFSFHKSHFSLLASYDPDYGSITFSHPPPTLA